MIPTSRLTNPSRLLNIATALCLIATPLLPLLTWWSADGQADPSTTKQSKIDADLGRSIWPSALPADDPLWSRALGGVPVAAAQPRPIAPRPMTVQQPSSPPIPTPTLPIDLGVRLVGTVLEQGNSVAILMDRSGRLDFAKAGGPNGLLPDGFRLHAILADGVQVRTHAGQIVNWNVGQSLTGPVSSDASHTVRSSTLDDSQSDSELIVDQSAKASGKMPMSGANPVPTAEPFPKGHPSASMPGVNTAMPAKNAAALPGALDLTSSKTALPNTAPTNAVSPIAESTGISAQALEDELDRINGGK